MDTYVTVNHEYSGSLPGSPAKMWKTYVRFVPWASAQVA